jgi:probable phosphoglycerate mutase
VKERKKGIGVEPQGVYCAAGGGVETLELWLVRHGETTSSRDGILAGWDDVPLTEKGVAQAEAVRPVLDGSSFTGVWSSDLERAVQSALLAWGAPVADPRLREINFGELEGASCGETLEDLRERVTGFLSELAPGRHLLFTHGGVIRLLTREAGQDGFVPTGTVVVLDWSHRAVLFKRESPIPGPMPFSE